MPLEHLPRKKKREPRQQAELFPRTRARVLPGPADRMLHREARLDRHLTNRRLRQAAEDYPEPAAIDHVTD